MTESEANDYAKRIGLFEKSTSLVGFSNGHFTIDGDLLKLQSQAKDEGVEFYLLKGVLPPIDKKKNGTSGSEVQ